jgi:peptide/nickel transport system substrate-binding protein
MRGYAHPTGLMVGPGVNGYDPGLDKRFPVDIDGAKKLLADAGYPDGFEVGFDCPTDRYVNDEQVCQAVVAMLAKIGIKVNLLAQTRAKYFGKILGPGYNTSFYLLGWTPGTQDALDMIKALAMTRSGKIGTFNVGGYSNPTLDDLAGKIQVELNQDKRNSLIAQALTLLKDDFAYIPLHQQIVVWATRDNVSVAPMGNNLFQLRYVSMK